MTETALSAGPLQAPEENTPAGRLMDLLAGWSQFVSMEEDEGRMDDTVPAETIGALYQEAGQLSTALEGADRETEAARVVYFVAQRVVPLLLGQK